MTNSDQAGKVNFFEKYKNITLKKRTMNAQEAVEFADWVGNQGLFCGLSPDNVRRWHKLVGDSKSVTTQELYQLYLESKKNKG